MPGLESTLIRLRDHIPHLREVNEKVSTADVGWHIAHTCIATVRIIDSLKKSDPRQYRRKLNLLKSIVLFTKHIPRGKGKAPKSTLVQDTITEESLHEHIAIALSALKALDSLDAKHNFLHPYFGKLNRDEALRFLSIHANHHLKIIDDIVKQRTLTK